MSQIQDKSTIFFCFQAHSLISGFLTIIIIIIIIIIMIIIIIIIFILQRLETLR